MSLDANAVVDRIYEASLVPELWQPVIGDLCAVSGSASGTVFVADFQGGVCGIGSRAIDDVFQQTLRDADWLRHPRPQLFVVESSAVPNRFFRIHDLLSADELARDPVEQVMRQHGYGFQAATVVRLPNGDTAVFTFERRFGDGRHADAELERLDAMRPHLARAAVIAAQLELKRARSMVSTLDAIGMPAAVLTPTGRALAVNASLERCRVLLPGAFEKIVVASRAADALLQSALRQGTAAGAARVRSIAVPPGRQGDAPSVLHLVPVRGAAHDVFTGAAFLLIVTTFGAHAALPDLSLLHGLFDLTPKEAALAAALASGLTLKQAAAQHAVRMSTARTHLEHIFQKTGTHQQSQLVLLLKSAQPFKTPR